MNDVTSGILKFDNGVQGTVQLTFNGDAKEDKLRIIGSKGHIDLSIMSFDPVTLSNLDGKKTYSFEELEHVQQPFIQQVVDSMHGLNDMDTTGMSGFKTQEILEKLNIS